MTKIGVPAPILTAPRRPVNHYPIDEMRVLREAFAFESSQALAMYGAAMRTTDPEPQPFQPLGTKVPKPEPAPAPKPASAPQGPYGVVTMPDGSMRTTRDNLLED